MKNSNKNIGKLLIAALFSGAILFGGNSAAFADSAGEAAFKAEYLASPTDNRIMKADVDFFGPYFHADINGKGQMLKDGTVQWEGNLNWAFTDKKTNATINKNIPLYLEQKNGIMTLYVYRQEKWYKYALPGIPAGVAEAIKTTDNSKLNANIEAVKSAQILDEDAKVKKISVTFDGKKLANILQNNVGNTNNASQQTFANRVAVALNKADLAMVWDVNKTTHQTVTVTVNMTPIIREYAKGIIDEMAAGKITLSEEEKNYYAALGYYVELPIVISALGVGENLMMPNLSGAKYDDNIFSDIRSEIATTSQK